MKIQLSNEARKATAWSAIAWEIIAGEDGRLLKLTPGASLDADCVLIVNAADHPALLEAEEKGLIRYLIDDAGEPVTWDTSIIGREAANRAALQRIAAGDSGTEVIR